MAGFRTTRTASETRAERQSEVRWARGPARAARALGLLAVGCALAACAGGGGGGGAGSAAGSAAGAATAAAGGPLGQKAHIFDARVAQHHLVDGLLLNVRLDAQGQLTGIGATADACIWTGVYAGTQALRYRVTGEPAALANMERALWAMHDLQDITGVPGFVARVYAQHALLPSATLGGGRHAGRTYIPETSRDQYIGLIFGYSLAWDVIQDPALRQVVRQDVRQIADQLTQNDLTLRVTHNGATATHFSFDPTYAEFGEITPQKWATVDDFPVNLIARAIPYDATLARALEQMRVPPVRGSQYLHALALLRMAAHVTGDPAYDQYYEHELIGRRGFLAGLATYGHLDDRLFVGEDLHLVEQTLLDLNRELTAVVQAVLQTRIGALSWPAALLLQVVFDQALKVVADAVTDTLALLNDPHRRQQVLQGGAAMLVLAQVLDAIGERDGADALRRVGAQAIQAGSTDMHAFADSFRGYVGENLFHLSSYAILSLEPDAAKRVVYEDALARAHRFTGDEQNAFFNFVAAAFGADRAHASARLDALGALADYPLLFVEMGIDNSALPGLRVSPYPDRFGVVGAVALDVFPLDRRFQHHFTWQEHPRTIRRPGSPTELTSNLGYLTAYWIGRYHGLIQPQD